MIALPLGMAVRNTAGRNARRDPAAVAARSADAANHCWRRASPGTENLVPYLCWRGRSSDRAGGAAELDITDAPAPARTWAAVVCVRPDTGPGEPDRYGVDDGVTTVNRSRTEKRPHRPPRCGPDGADERVALFVALRNAGLDVQVNRPSGTLSSGPSLEIDAGYGDLAEACRRPYDTGRRRTGSRPSVASSTVQAGRAHHVLTPTRLYERPDIDPMLVLVARSGEIFEAGVRQGRARFRKCPLRSDRRFPELETIGPPAPGCPGRTGPLRDGVFPVHPASKPLVTFACEPERTVGSPSIHPCESVTDTPTVSCGGVDGWRVSRPLAWARGSSFEARLDRCLTPRPARSLGRAVREESKPGTRRRKCVHDIVRSPG